MSEMEWELVDVSPKDDEITQLKKGFDAIKSKARSEITRLRNERNECRDKLQQTVDSRVVDELKSQVASLTTELSTVKSNFDKCSSELQNAKSKMIEASSLKSHINSLSSELKTAKSNIEKCAQKILDTKKNLNKCNDELKATKSTHALENISEELVKTKTKLEKCLINVSSDCKDDQSKKISKINVKSNAYILPYIEKKSLISFELLDVDRFRFNTSNKIAEGSFGSIYSGVVKDVNSDPLKSGKYVIKILNQETNDRNIRDASIEINIQNLIYDMMMDELKTPYIYKKLFVDSHSKKMGFVSEFIKSTNIHELICGYDKGVKINNGATYSAFKKNILNPLNRLYTEMDNNRLPIMFKHNDMHFGNIMIKLINNNNLELVVIDYGLTTIQRVYSMYIDNTIVDYFNQNKLDTYINVYGKKYPQPDMRNEFTRYMTKNPMSDYHLYVFSACCQVLLNVQQLSAVGNIDINNNINNNGWGSLLSDYINKYGFLSNLSVDRRDIKYRNNIISTNHDYRYLYYYMIDNVLSKNLTSPITNLILNWNIIEWRIVAMFIEIYIKPISPSSYANCISPF